MSTSEIQGFDNPIERLRDLWQTPADVSTTPFPSPSNLAELRLRLLKHSLPAHEESPLSEIFDSAMESVLETGPWEYTRPQDPMQFLNLRVSGVDPEPPAKKEEPKAQPAKAAANEASPLSHILGQELLNLAQGQSLSPEARAEALEATALALVNPTQDNVRAILRALIRGLKV